MLPNNCICKLNVLLFFFSIYGCENSESYSRLDINGNYGTVSIRATSDTIKFPLDEDVLPHSQSFNYQELDGRKYIAFTDRMSQRFILFEFSKRKLILKIHFPEKIKKLNAFFKNFDSIYVVDNNKTVYRFDTSGSIKETIDFGIDDGPITAQIYTSNSTPLIFDGDILYFPAYPNLVDNKLSDMQEWKVLYKLDIKAGRAALVQKLPGLYMSNLYGANYLFPYYCYNDRRQFVFSFAADPFIYVSNQRDHSVFYSGESKFLSKTIEPVKNKKELNSGSGTTNAFLLRDSYGPIYYDSFHKRYLRVAERKISKADFLAKIWDKEHSLIIFDQEFNIVGESTIDRRINLKTLFISSDGIFARIDGINDEGNLYFVRLEYSN